jgi:putative aldouronate transport system permease protein
MKRTRGEKIFGVINIFIIALAAGTCLLPFIHVLAKSFSDEISVLAKEVVLVPKGFNINAYEYVLNNPQYRRSMLNSIFITISGTALSLAVTTMTAYAFTRKDLPGKGLIVALYIITMFFGGGIIPTYILYSDLNLIDTYTVLILPGAIGVFNIILMRNFFESLSPSLEESAKMDGASNFRVLLQIYLPLSKAALATIGLFFAVGRWNAFFDAVIYTTKREMMPIQLYLRNILSNLDNMLEMDPEQLEYVCAEGVRSATIISAVIPILLVYPLVQKYFVKGIMIGAIKE